jgi:hypothetical protein
MDAIEKDVKSIILTVAELPNEPDKLDDGTTLFALDYNNSMCDDLAEELDNYVKAQKPTAGVASIEISTHMCAGDVIALIKSKLA